MQGEGSKPRQTAPCWLCSRYPRIDQPGRYHHHRPPHQLLPRICALASACPIPQCLPSLRGYRREVGWSLALGPVAVGMWKTVAKTVADTAGLHTDNSLHSSGREQPCSIGCRGMKSSPKHSPRGSDWTQWVSPVRVPRAPVGTPCSPGTRPWSLSSQNLTLYPSKNCPNRGNWQDRSPRLQLPPNNALF